MNNAKLKTRPRSEATAKDVGKRRAPVKKAATQRDLYAGHRLCTLRTLPGPLYREVVRRFAYGETAKEVAEFILAEKDRGGCQTFTFHTLRQYLQVLRKKVRAVDREDKARLDTLRKMARQIQKEEIRQSNVVAIRRAVETAKGNTLATPEAPDPVVRKVEEIEKELIRITASLSTRQVAVYNYVLLQYRIDTARERERNSGVLMDAITRMQVQMLRCADVLLGCDRAELDVHKRQVKMRTKGIDFPV